MKPQEKLFAFGAEQLTFGELCALLIRTGRKGKSAMQIGEELTPLIHKNKNYPINHQKPTLFASNHIFLAIRVIKNTRWGC